MISPPTLLLAESGGLVYSFLESTIEGKIVLLVLFLGSIFSWSVMVTKIRYLHFAKRQSERFSALFRRDRAPLRIFEQGIRFEGSPLYEIYKAGCVELCFQLLGSSEVDETFRDRLETADKITPPQMRAVTAAMERAVGEAGLKLESQMIILSTAVSGAPFLGLLGTVWGVMDAFGGIARTGQRESCRDGARGGRRSDYDGLRTPRGDSGDVSVQLSGHQRPLHDCAGGELCRGAFLGDRAPIR